MTASSLNTYTSMMRLKACKHAVMHSSPRLHCWASSFPSPSSTACNCRMKSRPASQHWLTPSCASTISLCGYLHTSSWLLPALQPCHPSYDCPGKRWKRGEGHLVNPKRAYLSRKGYLLDKMSFSQTRHLGQKDGHKRNKTREERVKKLKKYIVTESKAQVN